MVLWLYLKSSPTTYTGHVILEISTTETTYVEDLTDIVEVSFVFKHMYVSHSLQNSTV